MRRGYGPPLGWGIVPGRRDPEAVLITGVFGSGKSSVAVEIADVLEGLDLPHVVLDLDFRLRCDVTTDRRDDLRRAAEQIATSEGVGIEDITVANNRPIREVALGVLDWLGWD